MPAWTADCGGGVNYGRLVHRHDDVAVADDLSFPKLSLTVDFTLYMRISEYVGRSALVDVCDSPKSESTGR